MVINKFGDSDKKVINEIMNSFGKTFSVIFIAFKFYI